MFLAEAAVDNLHQFVLILYPSISLITSDGFTPEIIIFAEWQTLVLWVLRVVGGDKPIDNAFGIHHNSHDSLGGIRCPLNAGRAMDVERTGRI